MPELPEVETITRQLRPALVGKTIRQLEVRVPKMVWIDNHQAQTATDLQPIIPLVEQHAITAINRRAKMIIIHLSGQTTLLLHLKMTGQLIYLHQGQRLAGGHPSKDMVGELPTKSTHLIFHFNDGSTLFFNDLRKFGYLKIIPTNNLASHQTYQQYGPEPLEPEFNTAYLTSQLARRPKATIKQLLLDQSIIAGIGNIYADESLFAAQILPSRPASSLTSNEVNRLTEAIKTTLQKGIDFGGTSQKDYIQPDGTKGTMQDHLAVYRRTDLPCPVCRTPIERITIAGRSTHYCPHCQPLAPKPSKERNKA